MRLSRYWAVAICMYLMHTSLGAITLEVIDRGNVSTEVQDIRIYYTSRYGGSLAIFYSPDSEYDGFRLKKGEGVLLVKWEKIKKLEFYEDNKVNIILNNGKNYQGHYVMPSSDGLAGDTDLGEFTIMFSDIKIINVKHVEMTD